MIYSHTGYTIGNNKSFIFVNMNLSCNFIPRFLIFFFSTVAPCILIVKSIFIYTTDAQLYCSKRMSKFTLKCSYMFRFNNHHQGATIHGLLKL